MYINWRIGVLFYLLLTTGNLMAQSFSATSSRSSVGEGERFRITYNLENISGRNFKLASISSNFSIVGGPYQSQQMSFVNGQTSQSLQISYDLVAKKKGKFKIGPATIQTSNGTLKSNSLTIEVGTGSTGNNKNRNASQPDATSVSSRELFIIASANKKSVYVGEQIALTIKLYSRFNSVSLEDIQYPELKGGWVQDVEDAIDTRFRQEIYNGKRYNVATLRKSILVPSKPGTLVFDPVISTMIVQKTVRSNDWWENFFGGKTTTERINLKSTRINFDVKPLPEEGKPEGFSNAVGKYEFKVETDKDEMDANDALTLKVTVSGNGNLMLLQNPVLKFPNHLKFQTR